MERGSCCIGMNGRIAKVMLGESGISHTNTAQAPSQTTCLQLRNLRLQSLLIKAPIRCFNTIIPFQNSLNMKQLPFLLGAIFWALALGAIIAPPARDLGIAPVRPRDAIKSNAAVYHAIRRAVSTARLTGRQIELESNSTVLDKSWVDAVLFAYPQYVFPRLWLSPDRIWTRGKANAASSLSETEVGQKATIENSIEIVCTTCYIKGKASSKFTIDGNFDAGQALKNFSSDVINEVGQLGGQVVDYIMDYVPDVATKMKDGFDLDDFDLPPAKFDFNVDVPEIPEFQLQFKFEDMELYMLIDTVLSSSATYNLNLYTSNTPIGLSVSKDLMIGVVLSIDLILSVNGEIDISTGFHIKLDEGVTIDISLFSDDVSKITL